MNILFFVKDVLRLKHDCVIYIDQWQNKDLGTVEVTNQFVEFTSDDRHIILAIDTIKEVRIEQDLVKILDLKREKHYLRFLNRPSYKKMVFKSTIS